MTAEQKDTPMGDALNADAAVALILSDDEKQVLSLYDQLKVIQLEIALLKARKSFTGDAFASSSAADIEAAQKQLLEARALYVLRSEVVDSVLTVNPILKAVHHATYASPIERDLLLAIEQRDATSEAVAHAASARHSVRAERAAAAVDCRQIEQQNMQLAAQVRDFVVAAAATEQTNAVADGSGSGDNNDDVAAAELAQLEASVKESRQRWKLIKGAASAIVVGSGVDWVRDAALRDIVLDPE